MKELIYSQNLSIIIIIFTFLFGFYKLYFREKVFKHGIQNKRYKEFVKFIVKKKNIKNKAYTEQLILYMYNYFIPYRVIKILLNLESPIGAILEYKNLNRFFYFKSEKLCFKRKYETARKRNIYYYFFFIIGILLFIFAFILFAFFPKNGNLVDILLFWLCELFFAIGFFVGLSDADNLRKAEKFVEVVNIELNKK
ncbi:MAG: hypothetical protein WA916_15730 [Arcobacter sp.]|uniref:hypothetical protein n=1 Tax=Arcobacter sp. TaxID=1872629 RepID=UPI003C78B130